MKGGRIQGRQKKKRWEDRPGVFKFPEGGGRQRKIDETGCEVTCGAPKIPVVKGYVKVKKVMQHLNLPVDRTS